MSKVHIYVMWSTQGPHLCGDDLKDLQNEEQPLPMWGKRCRNILQEHLHMISKGIKVLKYLAHVQFFFFFLTDGALDQKVFGGSKLYINWTSLSKYMEMNNKSILLFTILDKLDNDREN